VIALDTNILVYAHREEATWHEAAYAGLVALAEGRAPWAIPWPCVHEFLAIVTHPRIYAPSTPLRAAIDQVEAWLEAPTLILTAESHGHWIELRSTLETPRVAGPQQVHDARIAALCAQHAVRELWSSDRDFSRLPGLAVVNPLIA